MSGFSAIPSNARRRSWSGALLASGLGLVMAAAWYHFQGLAPTTTTLVALIVGAALFGSGIVIGRRAARSQ